MNKKQIIMYKTTWCGDCRRAEKFLTDKDVPFKSINIETDPDATQFVTEANHGYCSVPTIVFPNGSILVEPTNETLARTLKENGLL